ncbi:glycosyl hydrolase family 20, catalytic domain protein [Dictyocaulus viviparus]|uniref:Beta-hexosaminidase n=1 Tax=Dictyocaulus viviparus TaxID=29172 RepID=A0A0D8Y3D6_DICVI|nr:glycosyl hydrolase family 20, catalytic domain protein [Dictyocaulus viviparus]
MHTNLIISFIYLLCNLAVSISWYYGRDEPDRWSVGEIWPLPQHVKYGKRNRTVSPGMISFEFGERKDCDILLMNGKNYLQKWMFPFPVHAKKGGINYVVTVNVTESCPSGFPQHGDSEEYKLRVSIDGASITSQTVWGAVRAMESFSQLIFYDQKKSKYKVRTVEIHDYPRFPIRGIMIDTSRHYISTNVIKRQLDIMAMNKMNVLHWHLVDTESFPYVSPAFPQLSKIDIMAMNKMNVLHWHLVDTESFPYVSTVFPQLSKIGAYSPNHVYTPDTVRDILQFARIRGIRVIPEFDLPGHTGSWRGQPGLLTECFDEKLKPTYPNLFDPSKEDNFQFLSKFFTEVVNTFPEEFLHLGGDEVDQFIEECWERNEKIQKFMEQKSFGNNTTLLENYFFDKLMNVVDNLPSKRKAIFWQEVFDNNKPKKGSIFHVWKGSTHEDIMNEVDLITSKGFNAIVSACWYLNYIKYGADWKDEIAGSAPSNSRYYYCDPTAFNGTEVQKALVLGGIAAMWGEFVDSTNIESRLWPRASAVAERLWSPEERTLEVSGMKAHISNCVII